MLTNNAAQMLYQHFDDEALEATYKDRARRLQWLSELQMRDEEAEREREQKKKEEQEAQAEMEQPAHRHADPSHDALGLGTMSIEIQSCRDQPPEGIGEKSDADQPEHNVATGR